ncbi:LysR substrate-binding domain-containing protein [Williamsia sp.]|uniref:LysR substrate-binding domain-containing protein n=1 Tax=Williamsia sp. TaxID=1872085 RepID=UPI002F91CA70
MDVAYLRAFLAVADELHFGRAAARLDMAQPALSRIIKQLERNLGTSLFVRNTRSVRLTVSGQALIGPATEVLQAVQRAGDAVRGADDGDIGVVRIAFAGVSTHRLVARLAREVRSRRPGIALELSSQNFAQPSMAKLLSGETDINFGRWDVIPAEVSALVVMTDSLVVAVPDTHRIAAARQISIAALADDNFISLPQLEGSVLPDRLRRLARDAGFVATIGQIAPDTQTALALVSAEVGAHLTLASVARNTSDPQVVFIPITESVPDVDLRAAWRTDDTNPALQTVLDELTRLDPAVVTS